jgi:DNA-binding winged helix-turn-helix (wHTH) protein
VPHFYDFGPFRLDLTERLLLRSGEAVALTPKAFDTLLMLVRNRGHIVEKDELLKSIWPETFVEEGTLAQNVFTLRKALGGSEGEQYIQTIPKRGYRFVASVTEVTDEGSRLPFGQFGTATDIIHHGQAIARSLAVLPLINANAAKAQNILAMASPRRGQQSFFLQRCKSKRVSTVRHYKGRN